MGFRDENEALRARAAAAEQRAGQAEDERERLNRELTDARANDDADAKRIAKLEKRLAKLEPPDPAHSAGSKKSAGTIMAGLAVGLAAVAGFVAFTLLRASEPSGTTTSSVATLPSLAEPAIAVPEPVVEVSPLERVRLAGVVRSVDGVDGLEAGAGCVADRGLGQRGFETLQVRCGTPAGVVTVFDGAADTGAGMMQSGGDTQESAASSGGVVRSMNYSLTGQWSGPQAQIQLDPRQHALRVWRSGLGARDLLVHLEGSAGSAGELTGPGSQNLNPFGRGTLARLELRGEAPSVLGELDTEDCVLRTEPLRSGPLTGRFLVRCGDRILYGAGQSGWVPAPAFGEIAGSVEDSDMSPANSDPAMTYTGDTLTLVEPEWRVMFDVRPHPSCSLTSSTWVGSVRGPDDVSNSGARLEAGTLTLPDGRVLEGEEEMRCHEGVARWASAEGEPILEGRFGPHFATFVGRLGSGELLELYRTR